MRRTVYKFTIQPILNPCGKFIVIVNCAFPLFKQGVIHIAFSSRNNQFEELVCAVVAVLAGIVMVNVPVDVLSAPKSNTAIDLFPWLAL